MISKIRQILSERYRLSGIRGCMAAGAVTAGIAAFAVIVSANADDVSTISLETDVIPDETAVVTEAQTEKRTYSRDIDFLFSEDIEAAEAAMKAEETNEPVLPAISEEAPETEAQTEAAAAPAEEDNEVISESEEETAEEETEAAPESEEEAAEENINDTSDTEEVSEDALSEEPAETNEELAEENIDSVSARSSAAGGDKENDGLSSALDLKIDDEAVPTAEYIEEDAETSDDTAAPTEDDDLNSIPEDITFDDEDEDEDEESENETAAAPQENAISLFELPEWLEFDENGVPTEYVSVLSGKACAYTAEPDALMSTGKEVFQGYVAVDPDIIPYGSELYIVAEDGDIYGYAIAADTGYSVRAGHIIVDLFMNEYDDCIRWGNKPVNVYVLK